METTAMLHILIDLGVLLAKRGPSAVDESRNGSQPGAVSRVASHSRHDPNKGEEHACNILDHCRDGRLDRRSHRPGGRRDG
jgi:hypothetical protein